MRNRSPLAITLFWIAVALLFSGVVYFLYEDGKTAALQYLTGYLLEKSLSLDNIFVISAIFASYAIPTHLQRRILTWGILTAVILRGIMILFGLALIKEFTWIFYLFGAILLFSGLQMLIKKKLESVDKKNIVIRVASSIFPVTPNLEGEAFFCRKNGKWMMTPLFLALLQVETADLIFAMDSIPAIFAITLDPFIVFTSNIFAILGLRALYFVIEPLLGRFHYLKASLALILVFIGLKMLLQDFYHISNLTSLAVIVAILSGGVIFSYFLQKR